MTSTAKDLPVCSIGCDPEFFVVDTRTQRVVSAHDLLPGTSKENPFTLQGGGNVQVDGLALEIGINPAYASSQFDRFVFKALLDVRKMIPKEYSFSFKPTVFFDKQYYDKVVPEENKRLGCTPDRDAYKNGAFNPTPAIIETEKGVMRTGAGHIHIGWGHKMDVGDPRHIYDCIRLVQNLDAVFGSTSHLWDDDVSRKEMYGKPGAFRVKPYGVEYRTLSNAWLRYPALYPFIFNAAQHAFRMTALGKFMSYEHPMVKQLQKITSLQKMRGLVMNADYPFTIRHNAYSDDTVFIHALKSYYMPLPPDTFKQGALE